jgi:hypothetical protein
MNEENLAGKLVRIAREIVAATSSIVLETPADKDAQTIVEFSEHGYRVLQHKGKSYDYLHFPLVEKRIRVPVRGMITVKKSRYPNECFAVVKSTDDNWDGHVIESTHGKRGDGQIGVTKDHTLPHHPDMSKKEKEYDEAVMAVLQDGRERAIDWSYQSEKVEYEGGREPPPPSDELKAILIQYWDKHLSGLPALGGPVLAWAFQGMTRGDMERELGKKIYLNR